MPGEIAAREIAVSRFQICGRLGAVGDAPEAVQEVERAGQRVAVFGKEALDHLLVFPGRKRHVHRVSDLRSPFIFGRQVEHAERRSSRRPVLEPGVEVQPHAVDAGKVREGAVQFEKRGQLGPERVAARVGIDHSLDQHRKRQICEAARNLVARISAIFSTLQRLYERILLVRQSRTEGLDHPFPIRVFLADRLRQGVVRDFERSERRSVSLADRQEVAR